MGAPESRFLLDRLAPFVGGDLASAILDNPQDSEPQIAEQRVLVAQLQSLLPGLDGDHAVDAARLATVASNLVCQGVWLIGGDGWAYDIGFGGLDHVLTIELCKVSAPAIGPGFLLPTPCGTLDVGE